MRKDFIAALVVLSGTGLSFAADPGFAVRPTATASAGGTKIDFTVTAPTDCAVSILDARGVVVRHLAAGVLGKNAPPPLKAGSLHQSIEWDGKADWGKPAGPGPFKVRVALGLGAKYDKEVIADPLAIGGVHAMAAAPDGMLYVVVNAGAAVPNWRAQRLIALNRDGTFQRTLIPLPSTATREQIEGMGGVPVEIGGRTVPMVVHVNERRTTAFWSQDTVAVTSDGKFLALHPDARMELLDLIGDTSQPLLGPPLLPKVPKASFYTLDHRQYLAASGDGRRAYFSGIAPKRSYSGEKTPPYSAVYRVKLPERSPAVPFFGDPEKTGSDETHLGSHAHGMASDGTGHLLICDPANKRVVVVAEADGTFAGSFPVDNPEFVAVDPHSGAVYVLTVGERASAEIVKVSGWKDAKPIASIQLRSPSTYLTWRFTADTSGRPAVLWASNGPQLFRIEDLGDTFSDARTIGDASITGVVGDGGFVNLTVDHYRPDPEVYVRITHAGYGHWFTRYNEQTDRTEVIKDMNVYSAAAGSCLEVGPDGNLYVQGWPQHLFKFDRNGKPLKWDVPYTLPEGVKPYATPSPPNAIFMPVVMVYMTHTLGIRPDGHLFAFEEIGVGGFHKDESKALFEYAPSGRRVGGPIVWRTSDSVIGPRFDQEGNIYVAEQIRPADQLIPPEFAGVVGPVTIKSGWPNGDPRAAIAQMYGSIVKFSPKGGSFGFAYYKNPFGEPKLDPAMKTLEAASWICQVHNRFSPNKVIGAEWMHMGISQINLHNCNCENTRFDVDPFGRVWYPDLGRYRVGVLDTNGNLITTFGGYGNAESRGRDSPVIDPETGKVRPRRADDPKDLESPFAEPEIAFAWLIGVGATDRYAYMGDSLNRRLLRAKLTYAVEETCEMR